MAYSKKKSPAKTRYTKSEKFNYESNKIARRVILVVIGLAGLTVILATLAQAIFTPENTVKSNVEAIVRDYYENYFYAEIIAENQTATGEPKKSLDEIMSRYQEPGFAKVPLRQLLLYDEQKYAGTTAILDTYCSLDQTYVKIYPDPPFEKTDYHVDYHYSCDFK